MSIFDSIINTNTAHSWQAIVIHHSATADGKVNDWDAIRKWHTGKIGSSDQTSPAYNPYTIKPMKDIGYHAGVEMIDNTAIYQTGRSLDLDGAHTIGMNKIAIGICLVGNYDVVEPDYTRYFMIASLCRAYMLKFGISIDNVYPHRQFAQKTCPGKLFDMDTLKMYINCETV